MPLDEPFPDAQTVAQPPVALPKRSKINAQARVRDLGSYGPAALDAESRAPRLRFFRAKEPNMRRASSRLGLGDALLDLVMEVAGANRERRAREKTGASSMPFGKYNEEVGSVILLQCF